MDAAEDYYVDGKPRHISDPSSLVFKILTQEEFERAEDKSIQNILVHQHIIVTGRKKPQYNFDPDGLETLAPLDRPIIIHGEHLLAFYWRQSSYALHD